MNVYFCNSINKVMMQILLHHLFNFYLLLFYVSTFNFNVADKYIPIHKICIFK